MANGGISAENPYETKRLKVRDAEMAYIEAGSGDPIVLIHGNPTTSYLWRNVIPHLEGLGRCLAPDLIGHGDSDKMPSGTYRFGEHVEYIDAWLEAVGATRNVTFVVHDWGAALGFYRTCRHPEQVAGIAYMEAMVRPRVWADLPEGRDKVFKAFRTAEGEKRVLQENFFIETMLFEKGIIRDLTDAEKAVYRAPYLEPGESRRVTLQWACEIPFDKDPADTFEMVDRYSKFLSSSDIPKLFINTDSGHALVGSAREFCRKWPNQTEITVHGRHYAQEDSPDDIGKAVAAFIQRVRG
ncbi:MAG: haloalkane dehalogenase [bacterium]